MSYQVFIVISQYIMNYMKIVQEIIVIHKHLKFFFEYYGIY